MKKYLVPFLKITVPLGLGVFLIWMVYKDLTPQDISDIKVAFSETNYFYIVLSAMFGLLSHASRAWRWKYPLKELGYNVHFLNGFYTVMIGYFANMGIPRSGEIMRCGLMAKYEDIPFNKLVGTVIAERVADLLILIAFIFLVIFLQFEKLSAYLIEMGIMEKFSLQKILIYLGVLVVGGIVGFIILKKSNNVIILKIRGFLQGIFEGLKTIVTMKDKWLFIGHTIFIWLMYVVMFYITFYSLPSIENVPFSGIITAFVIGGISITVTNGGIGAYPLGMASVLALYGIAESTGYAFGWAVWTGQTVMLILGGLAAAILLPRFNKKREILP
ncbi:MAG: flippase-like domain-containing protein [Flavobacteriales bacterium]|nr:flippase-like domain-containing protein [Flavobacteriales bacterium]